MEYVPFIALAALIYKIFDTLRYAMNRDRNGVTSQLIVWIAGGAAVVFYAQTDYANVLTFGELTLHQMNIWTQLAVGFQLGSIASTGKDFFKAIDNNNSIKIPTLLQAGPAGSHAAPGKPGETVG